MRRDKAPDNQVVLENVGNPLGITLVSFLPLNRLSVFRVSNRTIAGLFKDIPNRNPVFACRFHTNVFAIVFGKPL
jgi:hypothetical protein